MTRRSPQTRLDAVLEASDEAVDRHLLLKPFWLIVICAVLGGAVWFWIITGLI
jgi:hypothetical protein